MPDQPPYMRIAEELHRRLASQEWVPGDRLPSRAALGREYGVGDNVVRRAEEELIGMGLLDGRPGSGTYVLPPRERLRVVRAVHPDQPGGSPYQADRAALGRRAECEKHTDAKVPAPKDIAERLGIAEGDLCVRTKYELLVDNKPAQICTSWEPYALTAGTVVVLPDGGPLAGAGVVRRMAEIGITVTRAVESPFPRAATAEEANLLGILKGTPVTNITRTFYAAEGHPVETADIVIPSTVCEIIYEFPVTR